MWAVRIALVVFLVTVVNSYPWKTIDGRCYYYSDERQDWFTAEVCH